MKLIPLDAVLAEIEKLKDEAIDLEDKSRWFLSAAIKNRINSLEVTEIDLDKPFEGVKVQTSMESGSLDEVIVTTKYKAQKGKKV